MMQGNIKMALAALRSAKWRSLLTMLGIIIGVMAVITTVSLGEGVKRQVAGQIDHLGNDLISVRPGKYAGQNASSLSNVNLFSSATGATLSENDLSVVQKVSEIKLVVPVAASNGVAEVDGIDLPNSTIIATSENLPVVMNQNIEFGSFFTSAESNRHVAVIGKRVAEQLFKENVPLGRTLKIRGQDFIVRGVFEEFEANPLTPGTDLNKVVFIPYPVAKEISDGTAPISQIIAKAHSSAKVPTAVGAVQKALREAHAEQDDFSVLTQKENLAASGNVINLITQLITGIAAISLIVGGIGIMNIMLVSVSERTREIGIRKALGATNRQILSQFLIEAAVLSIVGGLIGVGLAITANFVIRIFTDLHPVVTLPVILIATGMSWVVGIVFGVTPAIKAARKDPIDALRYE